MNYTFIINPHSGRLKSKGHIKNLILKKFNMPFDIQITSYAGHASKIASKALTNGVKNIIAVGGDGTMNEVAKMLVNKIVNFGLVPMGSGNGFARSLNIPLKVENALDEIKKGKIKKIDVGLANDIYFFVVAGLGLEANVALRFQKSKKRGPLPYFYNGFIEYINYTYPTIGINSKEYKSNIKPLTLAIANAPQYGNNAFISPTSDMQDGMLDVCVINKMSLTQSIKAIKDLFNNKIVNHKFYSSYKSKEIKITCEEKMVFHTDGELNKETKEIDFKIKPKALNVIC